MHTCIMCLAVLSSLLNLMRGATSDPDIVESWVADSTGFTPVVMHLLGKGGETVSRGSKPGWGLLNNMDLLKYVDVSVWKPLVVW